MNGWVAKRFWKTSKVIEKSEGFTVCLDGRVLKTPAKSHLILPSREMAHAIAAEWDRQEGDIDPNTMPVTKSANAAIDKVATQHFEIAEMLTEYGNTDLLCYRAVAPEELIARQAESWDPILDWAAENLGARLLSVSGVMYEEQDKTAISRLRAQVHAMDNYALAAFYDLVSLSGSLVIAFAARAEIRTISELWELSRVDESWQEEQWGVDDEASKQIALKFRAFENANRFLKMT